MQLEKYKQRSRHNVTESTLNSRVSALNNLRDFVDHDGEVKVEDVEDWIDHLIDKFENDEIKAGTIKQYFKSVKYYWQTIKGDSEPIEHIREWIPTGKTDHGDFLDREEWDLLRSKATSLRLNCFIELMYLYARRPGEVRLINLDDIVFSNPSNDNNVERKPVIENVDDENEMGTITFNILKKDEPFRATYQLKPQAEQAIKDYLRYRTEMTISPEQPWEEDEVEPLFTTNQGRVSYDTIWKNIKELAQKAGIEKNITPKSMRHSRTTHLDWSGQSPEVIARQQLVHDPDSDVVGHYIHPRDEDQVREVMSLDDE